MNLAAQTATLFLLLLANPADARTVVSLNGTWQIAEGSGFLVALSTQLDTELIREGRVRDLVRQIQNLRKEIGLEVSDRIRIEYTASDEMAAAVSAHTAYLGEETLALEINRRDSIENGKSIKLGDESIVISISKA